VARYIPADHAFPVVDDHCHLDRRGPFLDAVRAFHRDGGTHLVVAHKPDFAALPTTREGYRESLEATCALVETVRQETPVVAWAVLSPHPVDIVKHVERGLPLAEAEHLVLAGIEEAAALVADGRAIALGEVGRPHFEVAPEVMATADRLFDSALALCTELDCAAVVHSESTTPEVCAAVAARARRAGMDPARVVKHYSPPLVTAEENAGLMPSVLASRPFCRQAASKGDRFMLETDYLDDPDRPGAVMALTTVPRRTYGLLQDGSFSEQLVHMVHTEWPSRTYGVYMGL
jgi:TatD-related deoxyribonuclease